MGIGRLAFGENPSDEPTQALTRRVERTERHLTDLDDRVAMAHQKVDRVAALTLQIAELVKGGRK